MFSYHVRLPDPCAAPLEWVAHQAGVAPFWAEPRTKVNAAWLHGLSKDCNGFVFTTFAFPPEMGYVITD